MLLIQLPMFNNIEEVKNKLKNISEELINQEFNFIVVDHSKKNYSNELELFCVEHNLKKLNYFHLKKKSKKNERGLASRYGYKMALEKYKKFYLVEIDSDTAHSEKEILKIFNHAIKNNCDIVVASKYVKNSKVLNRRLSRRFISYAYNYLNKIIFNLNLSDTSNSYRCYSKKALLNYTKLNLKFITPIAHLLLLVINNSYKLKFDHVSSIYYENVNYKSSINFEQLWYCLKDYLKLIYLYKTNKIN